MKVNEAEEMSTRSETKLKYFKATVVLNGLVKATPRNFERLHCLSAAFYLAPSVLFFIGPAQSYIVLL